MLRMKASTPAGSRFRKASDAPISSSAWLSAGLRRLIISDSKASTPSGSNGGPGLATTKASTRSGWREAKRATVSPPRLCPSRCALARPSPSKSDTRWLRADTFEFPFDPSIVARTDARRTTSVPQEDQKRPGTTRNDQWHKRLLRLGFGRFSLVTG